MKGDKLIELLEGVSTKDLENLIATKAKLDKLQGKKTSLEKHLASVSKELASIQASLGTIAGKKPAPMQPKVRKAAKKAARRAKRRRIVQPSASSLVVNILKEKKKPLKVNEIHDALLTEKKYKTQAKNFKANVRILLYTNKKGLFKKTGPGAFTLAGKKGK